MEEEITREITKIKNIFNENSYNIKEMIFFLEAKTKMAIALNNEILLEACRRVTQELKGQEQ